MQYYCKWLYFEHRIEKLKTNIKRKEIKTNPRLTEKSIPHLPKQEKTSFRVFNKAVSHPHKNML